MIIIINFSNCEVFTDFVTKPDFLHYNLLKYSEHLIHNMNKRDVLNKIDELCLVYENGVLSHPYWYIPPNKRHLIEIHDRLFKGKREMTLTLEEVAALFLVNKLMYLN